MANRKYLLVYPDGSRKHIDRETRDSLELSRTIRKTGPDRYLFTAKPQTYHSFADLKDYAATHDFKLLRRFLEGSFIFELHGRKTRELMETPEAMALRLCEQ